MTVSPDSGRLMRWSDDETALLVRLTEDQIAREKDNPGQTMSWQQHFKNVSAGLSQAGYNRTPMACRMHWCRQPDEDSSESGQADPDSDLEEEAYLEEENGTLPTTLAQLAKHKKRFRFNKEQKRFLEREVEKNGAFPHYGTRVQLAVELEVEEVQIRNWFNNYKQKNGLKSQPRSGGRGKSSTPSNKRPRPDEIDAESPTAAARRRKIWETPQPAIRYQSAPKALNPTSVQPNETSMNATTIGIDRTGASQADDNVGLLLRQRQTIQSELKALEEESAAEESRISSITQAIEDSKGKKERCDYDEEEELRRVEEEIKNRYREKRAFLDAQLAENILKKSEVAEEAKTTTKRISRRQDVTRHIDGLIELYSAMDGEENVARENGDMAVETNGA